MSYGLDKELREKMEAKYDLDQEKEAMEWISKMIGRELEGRLYDELKSGVVLCELIRAIRPSLMKEFEENPTHVLEERDNIQKYINACVKLRVPSQELFVVGDLHSKKYLNAVLINLFALGRQVQVIKDVENLPKLGVKYSVSLEEQEKRKQKKLKERQEEEERQRKITEERIKRREELEHQSRLEKIHDSHEEEVRALNRKLSKGRIDKKQYTLKKQASFAKKIQLESSIEEDPEQIEIEAVKYGLDLEIEKKMKQKYKDNIEDEEAILEWIELTTNIEIDSISELKTGIVLCELINCVRPGTISKINESNHAAFHRDNIKLYLDACKQLRVKALFNVSDLYEERDLAAVVANIYALSQKVELLPSFKGPTLNRDGSITVASIDPVKASSCCNNFCIIL